MGKEDYSMLDDGGCECLHCLRESTSEELKEDGPQHFKDCPMIINDDDTNPQGDK